MEAVILMGIQGAGKTSFYLARFFDTHVRLGLDLVRTRRRERLLMEACLRAGQRFVIDATNPTAADRACYLEPARSAGFRAVGYYLRSSLAEAFTRNAARARRARVPEVGIRGTHARLELPGREEGFDELYYVRIDVDGGFAVEEWRDEVQ